VFGSVARGEDQAGSDIDFLVEFEAGSSLFDLIHLQDELSALLGCRVDVVSVGGLKPRDAHILEEALPL
jgi:predicted nucleotidyltransferase